MAVSVAVAVGEIADDLVKKIQDKSQKLKVAPWTDNEADMGPVISKEHKQKIENYILDIIFSTRKPSDYNLKKLSSLINFGASPRGSINLAKASRVYAFIQRRGYVVPEDVRAVCHDVLRHRIGLTYEAEAENVSTEEIIDKILNTVEVP